MSLLANPEYVIPLKNGIQSQLDAALLVTDFRRHDSAPRCPKTSTHCISIDSPGGTVIPVQTGIQTSHEAENLVTDFRRYDNACGVVRRGKGRFA